MTKNIGEMLGSEPIEVFKPHWFMIFTPLVSSFFGILGIFVFYYFYKKYLSDQIHISTTFIFIVSGFLFLFSIGPLISSIITRETTSYGVFSDRITFRTGFISRSVSSILLSEMTSIDLHQSIVGRIFNFGTVKIEGRGGDKLFGSSVYRAAHLVEIATKAQIMARSGMMNYRGMVDVESPERPLTA